MQLDENAQELLERLWVSTEEEAKSGLAINGTMSKGVEELVLNATEGLLQLGLAKREDRRLALTAAGRSQAAQAVRRHRLAERLLADLLKTEGAFIDEHACRLEHTLLDGLNDEICTLLGHPRFCPHGKPIPEGACCRQKRALVDRVIAPLDELQPGQGGHIAYIQMHNPQRLQKLIAMGVLPGVPITLSHRFPSFVFEANYSQFAVDKEIATAIYVRLASG